MLYCRRREKDAKMERERVREKGIERVGREGKKERLGVYEVMSPRFPHQHMHGSLSQTVAQQRERDEGNRGMERWRDSVGEREKCESRL